MTGEVTPLPDYLQPEEMQETFDRIRTALDRLTESIVRFRTMEYRQSDPREGEEIYVHNLRPGTRVYVLDDVFTVDRVDDSPVPTVWLRELPTSPLYFSESEYIYLANETED